MPGDLALIDSRSRYELHFPAIVDTYSLQIPIEWLDTWVPDTRRHLGHRIDGTADHVVVISEGTGHGKGDELLERSGVSRNVRLIVLHFVA